MNPLQRILAVMQENDLFAEPKENRMVERTGFAFDLEKLANPDSETSSILEDWFLEMEQNFGPLEFDASEAWGAERTSGAGNLVLAWYQPLTYHRENAGVYLTDFGIWHYMRLLSKTPVPEIQPTLFTWPKVKLPLHVKMQMAIELLLLHELFHHDVESFAIRLNPLHQAKSLYSDYDVLVYPKSGPLEEALATAKMQIGIKSKPNLNSFGMHAQLASELIAWDSSSQPPGYRDANLYNTPTKHAAGRRALAASINQLNATPKVLRSGTTFGISKGMLADYFRANFLLVPISGKAGTKMPPSAIAYTIKARSIEKLLIKHGYWDSGLGKGSHTLWQHRSEPAITLPHRREYQGFDVLKDLARALGYTSLDALRFAAYNA